jgi:hypothetical protein
MGGTPMNIGKACAIFLQIESDQYTDRDKEVAIYLVMNMPTHNGITKDSMLRVIKWMFAQNYTIEENNV